MTRLLSMTMATLLSGTMIGTAFAPAAEAGLASDLQETATGLMREAKLNGAAQQRALAMMHIAMFDAVNALEQAYEPYAYSASKDTDMAGAAPEAAAIQAAMTVIAAAMPDQKDLVETTARDLLDGLPDQGRAQGVALGTDAASAVISMRQEDGADFSSDYKPATAAAGVYQKTSDKAMKTPRIREMMPFVLRSRDQFKVPPPPSLDSHQYQNDLAEVYRIGGQSTQTDPDLIQIAKRHNVSGSGAWNSIARRLVRDCNLDLIEESRALALLNITLTDALIAGFNGKYEYGFWRPETAIAALGTIYDHPTLDPDPDWMPVLPAPMHPEYPCQHCTTGAAGQAALESIFGADPIEVVFSSGGEDIRYPSLAAFAEEQSESRVLGGVHYRRSNTVGNVIGHQVGTYAGQTVLQPVSGMAKPLSCSGATDDMSN